MNTTFPIYIHNSLRHLATVDKRFVTLQRIRIVRVTSGLSWKKHKSTYRNNEKQDAKVL